MCPNKGRQKPSRLSRRAFKVVRGRFASNAALITHGFYDALAVFHHHDRRVVAREYARVTSLGLSPLDVFELAELHAILSVAIRRLSAAAFVTFV